MAFNAQFAHGDVVHIDYTPTTGNVAAGAVIALSNTGPVGMAFEPILNNVLGSLALGGVWNVTNLNNAANYAKVYWDATNNKVTTVSTNNALFGTVVSQGGGGANSTCRVLAYPYAQ